MYWFTSSNAQKKSTEFGASNEMVAVENDNTSKDVTSYKSFRENLLYRHGILKIVTCQKRRDQIHNDILELYNENKKSRHFVIYFENEEAVWEGVTCDAYKLFYEHMFQSFFEGENEKISLPTASPEFLRKIGFIVANTFIHYEVFTIRLCKASLINILFGTVNSGDFLSSYVNYLPNKERSILQQFRQCSNADV